VTWTGGSQDERRAAREVLDLELNTRTFYGTIAAELGRDLDGSWRVRRATIGRPQLDPNDLLFEEGVKAVIAALQTGGLSVSD
jgi:hypothetical protein